jgi:hypothetical protein
MSEAKPQDGSTVKGYRTLTAGDIERMNRLCQPAFLQSARY